MIDSVATMAAQPEGDSRIETVSSLPDPTTDDIGRQVILQLPDVSTTSVYTGILLPDGTVTWQLTAVGSPDSAGSGGSLQFSFLRSYFQINTGAMVSSNLRGSTIYYISAAAGILSYHPVGGGAYNTLFTPAGTAVDGMAVGATTGTFYLSQAGNTRVRRYDAAGTVQDTSPTSKSYGALYYNTVTGRLFATAPSNNQWFKLNPTTLAIINTGSASIVNPQGICEDSAGNIYVANTGSNNIRKYDSTPTFLLSWGTAGSGNGQFSSPKGLYCDSSDRIYVCDSGNNRIQVFDQSGAFLAKFGVSGSNADQFTNPKWISGLGSKLLITDDNWGTVWERV